MNEEVNMTTKTKRKKSKRVPKVHRVYCTYLPDKRYYIGYSCKTEKQFEKYYGSNTIVKEALDWGLWLYFRHRIETKLRYKSSYYNGNVDTTVYV